MKQYSTFYQFLIISNEYKITTVQFENKYYINDFSRVKLFKKDCIVQTRYTYVVYQTKSYFILYM